METTNSYLLTLPEAAQASGKTIKWLKKRILDGSIEGTFQAQQWMVATNGLAAVCGELSLESISLGPDRLVIEDSSTAKESFGSPHNEQVTANEKRRPAKNTPTKQSSPQSKQLPTETERIGAQIGALEQRRREYKLTLEQYDRQAKGFKKRVPQNFIRKRRRIFEEYERVRIELLRLQDELKKETLGSRKGIKAKPTAKGISGYYVPGRLAGKRYWSSDEDAPRQ